MSYRKRSEPRLAAGLKVAPRSALTIALANGVVAGTIPAAAAQQRAPAPLLVLDGVTVVDVEQGKLLPGQRVVVTGNRIRTVGDTGAVKTPQAARLVDARGKYLIPGLWDMHSHPVDQPQFAYPLFIANGITGIRNASTWVSLDTVRRWQREILAGRRVGPPRQLITGPSLDDNDADFDGHVINLSIQTPEEGRRAVDSLKALGADFVKVHELNAPDVYFAIAAEARRLGIPFSGHLPHGVTVSEAADSGQRAFDHTYSLPPECFGDSANVAQCVPVVEWLRHRDAWLVPTLEVTGEPVMLPREELRARLRYLPDALSRKLWPNDTGERSPVAVTSGASQSEHLSPKQGVLTVLRQAGGDSLVLAGTDVGAGVGTGMKFMPGFSLHDELRLLVEAGLSPSSALRAATLNPARFFHATDSLGTVAPGKLADLVLLDANPLDDIRNTAAIRAVIANGRYFDRTAVEALLAELERVGDPRWR